MDSGRWGVLYPFPLSQSAAKSSVRVILLFNSGTLGNRAPRYLTGWVNLNSVWLLSQKTSTMQKIEKRNRLQPWVKSWKQSISSCLTHGTHVHYQSLLWSMAVGHIRNKWRRCSQIWRFSDVTRKGQVPRFIKINIKNRQKWKERPGGGDSPSSLQR